MATDPVHFDPKENAWYFWTETWSERLGPYPTRERANEECSKYARSLDNYRGVEDDDAE